MARSKGNKKTSFGAKPKAQANETGYVAKLAGFATGGAVPAAGAAPAAAPTSGAATVAAARADGGRIARARGGMCAPMQGMTSMKRLDRPGRKRGGAVGADSSPLTSAANLSGGDKS